jgi:hypothetical protein
MALAKADPLYLNHVRIIAQHLLELGTDKALTQRCYLMSVFTAGGTLSLPFGVCVWRVVVTYTWL